MTDNKKWEVVIGLEVHAQLSTETKIFCGCKSEYGAPANSRICPVCMGMPGVLPVLNRQSVEYGIKAGLAMNCEIASYSRFARKNYFYPDSPKGYQISQFEEPLCENGFINIGTDSNSKKIGITRIHLEEDAGKSMHEPNRPESKVDLNRAGVPLLEIVSEPDLRSPEESYEYLVKLKQLLRYLGISDCNMEEGSLRCDANISIRKPGDKKFGTKTELKNMNSFRGVEKALHAEIKRQIETLESGGTIVQVTNLWDESSGEIKQMRAKEGSDDYRYFPEPDLVPFTIDQKQINGIKENLPELPEKKMDRFVSEYKLKDEHALVLTASRGVAEYFEELTTITEDPKNSANWIMGNVSRVLNDAGISIDEFTVAPARLAELMKNVSDGSISISAARTVFDEMLTDESPVGSVIEKLGLKQMSDSSEIDKIVQEVIDSNPDEAERYKSGEAKLKGWFVGQIMKASHGKANPQIANESLDRLLNIDS
ncbi:Asp-tRNA(Asn)/Glu-tRNA(Gln) amidotransferase subunit GatB [Candidatus Marinimicrobia bacterium MT.SAG.3]|nr:Asp-tRNA(Asn)/Glu-tRNA(Gln) amidotransferase subunit GatB [Candidatus Marinimicrobia bacterium MT.SAG.3]